ncbi:MAG: cytochrome c5 family protein [Betaproteobacteria bacterium HGW-Betaproteobacteria-2]|nr:MAG: cytochrome c5 family protein [Betaproteobacteria bacterium HGW-Betaproteobacteria-2]
MSDQHHDFPKTTVSQVVLATVGGLLAPLLVIFLIFKLVMGINDSHIPDEAPEVAQAKVEERIAPVAEVDVVAVDAVKVTLSGDVVYQQNCLACHGSGAMGAPMFGDKGAWAPRIAQGYDTLLKHAIEGIRMMPAKGGNANLSDAEVANAVVYMANEAGAKFTAPAADAPAAVEEATPAQAPVEEVPVEEAPAAKTESKPTEAAAVAATPVAAIGKAGEQTYKAVCAMCHDSGLMNAPKPGDKDAWAPRIAQGKDTLIQHAIQGIRMMPAKGGNPSLSDDEVAQTVVYMANQSGANF